MREVRRGGRVRKNAQTAGARRPPISRAVVVAGAVLLAAALAVPVSAHINDVRADPQFSADGTVVAETAYVAADGWLAVYPNDSYDVPVGHVALPNAGGFKEDVTVRIDAGYWEGLEEGTVYLVLHRDDGDGRFEPNGADDVLSTFGRKATAAVPLRKADRPAVVTAAEFATQRTDGTAIAVRNATLPIDGRLVVANASTGRVLGSRELAAGGHANVSVPLTDAARDGTRFRVSATLHAGESGEETALTADGAVVGTTFRVEYTGGSNAGTPTPTPGDSSFINTPTATGTPATEADSAGGRSSPTPVSASASAAVETETTAGDGAGFGFLAALVALAGLVAFARKGDA